MDSTTLPLDTSCQAEYEDGYVLDETSRSDVSLWVEGKNIFHDILNRLPEKDHGKMIRFSVFWKDRRYDVDWTALPSNARPIRFRHGFLTVQIDGTHVKSGWSGVDFGYQCRDLLGRKHEKVVSLRTDA